MRESRRPSMAGTFHKNKQHETRRAPQTRKVTTSITSFVKTLGRVYRQQSDPKRPLHEAAELIKQWFPWLPSHYRTKAARTDVVSTEHEWKEITDGIGTIDTTLNKYKPPYEGLGNKKRTEIKAALVFLKSPKSMTEQELLKLLGSYKL